MSSFSFLVNTPLAKAVGETLFHFLWEGTAVAALLAAILAIGRPAPARVRYGLACAAMLVMPVAFAATLAWFWPDAADSAAVPVRLSAFGPPIGGLAGPPPSIALPLADRLVWATPLWLAGICLLLLYRGGGWLVAQRLRRIGVRPAPAAWQTTFEKLARLMKLSRPTVLLESCVAEVPVVVGWLRPVILMPVGMLAGLPPEQVEAILLHELAHIRRADYLINLMQTMVESVLFYHPAVWWVSGLVRAERENCCDDAVLALRPDVHTYAAALVSLERSRWRTPEPALAASGGSLLRRVRRLLGKGEAHAMFLPVVPAALVLITAGAALLAWQTPVPAPVPAPVPPTPPRRPVPPVVLQRAPVRPAAPVGQVAQAAAPPQLPLAAAYDKWVKEDVAYIITDEERSAFERLGSDAEREHFIEQFWQRRDPTPGTPINEFREEHYRRIAYANEQFGRGDLPGWKTDMGRIFIVYGPPGNPIVLFRRPESTILAWHYELGPDGLPEDVRFRMSDGRYQLEGWRATPQFWQVMAVSPTEAEVVVRTLKDKGFPATTGAMSGELVRVLVGPYRDEESMSRARTDLESAGFRPIRK